MRFLLAFILACSTASAADINSMSKDEFKGWVASELNALKTDFEESFGKTIALIKGQKTVLMNWQTTDPKTRNCRDAGWLDRLNRSSEIVNACMTVTNALEDHTNGAKLLAKQTAERFEGPDALTYGHVSPVYVKVVGNLLVAGHIDNPESDNPRKLLARNVANYFRSDLDQVIRNIRDGWGSRSYDFVLKFGVLPRHVEFTPSFKQAKQMMKEEFEHTDVAHDSYVRDLEAGLTPARQIFEKYEAMIAGFEE